MVPARGSGGAPRRLLSARWLGERTRGDLVADPDDLRFADSIEHALPGEVSVRWLVERAIEALGDAPVEVRLDTGPALKVMDPTLLHEDATVALGEGERWVDGRETVVGWDRIDSLVVPGVRAPNFEDVPEGRFAGAFRARLTFDYGKQIPSFASAERPALPLAGRRRLEDVLRVDLLEASDFGA